MNPEQNDHPTLPNESKDMHGRAQGPKRKPRYRLNVELDEELGALLEKELAKENMTQGDWVRAVISASLRPGRRRKIFEALMKSTMVRQRQAVLDQAIYLFSLIRSAPIVVEADRPLLEHVQAVLASSLIRDIHERLGELIRHVAGMSNGSAQIDSSKCMPNTPDQSESKTEGKK